MIDNMQDFAMWFLETLPVFLMSEPICYLMALAILLWVVVVVKRIISL